LQPDDRSRAAHGLANSFVSKHGIVAFDSWAGTLEPSLRQEVIRKAADFVTTKPVAESVPWLAKNSQTLGTSQLAIGFSQWVGSDAPAAFHWLASLPTSGDGNPNLSVQQLTSKVDAAVMEKFIRENPNHPALTEFQSKEPSSSARP
jgi:hypothetical protein